MNPKKENLSPLDSFIQDTSVLVQEQDVYLTHSVIIDLEELVGKVSEIISLPEIYLKIKKLIDDPHSDIEDFAVVVQTDPGLTTAVLKLVNSAFFGFPGQIEDINRALNLIGIGQLHDLVLSISAVHGLDLSNDIETLSAFWQRSIYCGVLSRLIAQNLSLNNADNLFVIGLLHEIGRLILFMHYPKQSQQAVIEAQKENLQLTDIEKSMFGVDYGHIGQALMTEWNLPSKFINVTGCHSHPEKATEFVTETYIVHIAHQIAVNHYPSQDNFQYELDEDTLARIKTSQEQITELCSEAKTVSAEMESLILG